MQMPQGGRAPCADVVGSMRLGLRHRVLPFSPLTGSFVDLCMPTATGKACMYATVPVPGNSNATTQPSHATSRQILPRIGGSIAHPPLSARAWAWAWRKHANTARFLCPMRSIITTAENNSTGHALPFYRNRAASHSRSSRSGCPPAAARVPLGRWALLICRWGK